MHYFNKFQIIGELFPKNHTIATAAKHNKTIGTLIVLIRHVLIQVRVLRLRREERLNVKIICL